jgi:hypothetical protein
MPLLYAETYKVCFAGEVVDIDVEGLKIPAPPPAWRKVYHPFGRFTEFLGARIDWVCQGFLAPPESDFDHVPTIRDLLAYSPASHSVDGMENGWNPENV